MEVQSLVPVASSSPPPASALLAGKVVMGCGPTHPEETSWPAKPVNGAHPRSGSATIPISLSGVWGALSPGCLEAPRGMCNRWVGD